MMKQWLTVLLLVAACNAQAVEIHSIKLAETTQVGDMTLVLNGAGTRVKLIFKAYVAALYVPVKKNDPAAILGDNGAKRLTLNLLRELSSDKMIAALDEGLSENHTAAELAALEPQIKAFHQVLASGGDAKSGYVIMLDYVPNFGTQVTLNGKLLGSVAGERFYPALLKIWLGEHPVDAPLKKALLGN